MGESSPRALVTQVAADEAVEGGAVEQPGDSLGLPVARGTINDDGPVVEVVVWNGDRLAETTGFVTDAAAELAAMDSAVTGQVAIDTLKDVELAACGPLGAVADSVAEHPEGGPHALLAQGITSAQLGLDAHDAAGLGHPCLLGLDAARGPLAIVGLAGDELEGVAAGELDVGVGLGVFLQLVVDRDIEGDVPRIEVD